MQSATLSRRSFVAGASAAVAAVACAPAAARASELAWTHEADVVVVGSGTAVFGALAAAAAGARVILVEKTQVWGGTAATSGGGFALPVNHLEAEAGIEDSPELALAYYEAVAGGRLDRAVASSFINKANEFLTWTEDELGLAWTLSPMYQDYYEPLEGYLPMGRGSLFVLSGNDEKPRMNGATLWEHLRGLVEERGIQVLFDTAATELITDADGAVVGIVAEGPEGTLHIGAKATVLGTGSFDHNDQMRARYMPIPLVTTVTAPGATGDGHRMGQALGADLAYMDKFWGVGGFLTTGEDPAQVIAEGRIVSDPIGADWSMYRCLPGAIVVNKYGRRFGDETAAYSSWAQGYLAYDNARMEFTNLSSFFVCDSGCWERYRLPGHAVGEELDPAGIWVVADTLEELAGKLGIDPAGLTDEVAAFNEHAAVGEDPAFLRGSKEFAANTCGVYAGDRPDLANPLLAPLAEGPFYGTVYVPGILGTAGGLVINEDAQVLRPDGSAIGGLYAAGNCSCGVSGGMYTHGGITLASGAVMSWAAARHALGIAE